MILLVLAILFPLALGLVVICLLCPTPTMSRIPFEPSSRSNLGLVLSLSVGLGYGLTSLLVFVWLLIVGRPSRGITVIEVAAVLAGGLWISKSKRRGRLRSAPEPKSRARHWLSVLMERGLLLALLLLLVIVLARFALNIYLSPYGYYDAWESWNMKARFVFLSGSSWRQLFTVLPDVVPDYPLLHPLSLVGVFVMAGRDSVLIPAIMAALYMLGIVGLVMSTLERLRSNSQSFVAAAVLLGTPFFVHLSYAEYADIPLAFLLLATVALLVIADSGGNSEHGPDGQYATAEWKPLGNGLTAAAGLAAGLSCWTKNEGVLFCAVLAGLYFLLTWRRRGAAEAIRRVSKFAAGAALPVLAVVYFKLRLAGTNSFVAHQGTGVILHKLLTSSRYLTVLKGFDYHLLVNFGDWRLNILLILAAYALLFGISIKPVERPAVKACAGALLVMLGAYFLTFVASPYDTPPFDITWFMLVTIQRLFMQIWPCFVLIFFISVRTPDEMLDRVMRRGTAPSTTLVSA
jgi:4-amino-4-deoxy-L-arabinose transferase-like glycosyltransferase